MNKKTFALSLLFTVLSAQITMCMDKKITKQTNSTFYNIENTNLSEDDTVMTNFSKNMNDINKEFEDLMYGLVASKLYPNLKFKTVRDENFNTYKILTSDE